jgi:hypothetical protein
MENFSEEIKAYFSSGDALSRAQLVQTHPELEQTLNSPELIAQLLHWLSTNEPWAETNVNLTMHVLVFLRTHARESDASIVKVFLLHNDPLVRLRAYEYLLTLYFPDKNREALFLLLQGMLSDQDEQVRAEAAGYIQRADAVSYLRGFLERWITTASERGWGNNESYELIERILSE